MKRSRPGRPRKDEVREVRSLFKIEEVEPPHEDAESVERADFHARHFVLVTDHLDETIRSDERVLREYRAQQVIERYTGFRWLKNIALVAPIFLHLPSPIAALGLMFVLALMVRNYMQATIRAGLKAKGENIPDRRNRPTQKPTMETAMRQLAAVVTTVIHVGDRRIEKRVQGLTEAGRRVLALLGLDEDVYLEPLGYREWGRWVTGYQECREPYLGIEDGHTAAVRRDLPDAVYAGLELELREEAWAGVDAGIPELVFRLMASRVSGT